MPWRTYLDRRSRDPAFLWTVATGIFMAGVLVSFVTPHLPRLADGDATARYHLRVAVAPDQAWSVVAEMAVDPNASFYEVLQLTAGVAGLSRSVMPDHVFGQSAVDARGEQAIALARELAASVRAGEPTNRLQAVASQAPPVRYANYALALFWMGENHTERAVGPLFREGDLADSKEARELLVRALVEADNLAALEKLVTLPEYELLVPYHVRAQLAAERGDWLTVLRYAPESLWRRWDFGPAVLAIFTGACWLAFLLHAGRVGHARGVRWWLCTAALGLGVLSVAVTHFFIYYQEVAWGLVERDDLVGGVKFFVLGVGLREELSKLLLLAPLVPLIVRRGSELEALIVSACVGLGFAVEENIGYFTGAVGTSTIGRFTTANFLHMALTGLVGLAVCRGVWHPRTAGPEAIAVFGVAVLLHGLYDALLAVPALSTDFSLVAMILYVLLAFQFFRELNAARPEGADPISLTFTFVVGIALVTSAAFVYVSLLTDQRTALRLIGAELLASGAMIYLFLRESPDSLIDR